MAAGGLRARHRDIVVNSTKNSGVAKRRRGHAAICDRDRYGWPGRSGCERADQSVFVLLLALEARLIILAACQ
jgi:hypothetical protein